MWKNNTCAIVLVLLLPLIVIASPQSHLGGYLTIGKNLSFEGGLNFIGLSYNLELVYKVKKIVNIPFINKKEVIIVPIKLGKNKVSVFYDGEINLQDYLQLNLYEQLKANIFGSLNSKLEFSIRSFVSYRNYTFFYSNKLNLVSFGMPIGISLKYSPWLMGLSVQNNNFIFSINSKGIDFATLFNGLSILIGTNNNDINVSILIPFD